MSGAVIHSIDGLIEGQHYRVRYRAGSRIIRRRLECLDPHGGWLEHLEHATARASWPYRRVFIGEDDFISAEHLGLPPTR